MTTIAFTGHRPKDMPEFTFSHFAWALDSLGVHKRSDLHFVVGGALGTDTWAAEYALSRHIPYTLVLPFPVNTMARFWHPDDHATLLRHVAGASDVQIVHDSESYDVRAYQERNERMVDFAQVVFALWSGKPHGGTANCVRYALKMDKPVYNLWPLDCKLHRVKP